MTTEGVVAALEHALCQRIGAPRYDLWFRAKTHLQLEPHRLRVGVPNRFFQEWLQTTFAADLTAVVQEHVGSPLPVVFEIEPALFQAVRQRQAAAQALACAPPPLPTRQNAPPEPAPRPRRWRKLADFAEGACNRVALAAARQLVEAPADVPSPLVLYGPVGCGKSHLLEGIYNGWRRQRPEWRVVFVTAEEFTHRFVQAMRLGKLSGFRKQFRDADALLVDDLQFLARKKATQEEMLHTLDALQRDHRPVAVACDGHPRLAGELLPELIDRLVGGAAWGLTYPDAETRLAILRSKNAAAGADAAPDAALRVLATELRGNVRELEGAWHSLRHLARVSGRPIDAELARAAVAEVVRHAVRLVQLPDIDRAVCSVLALEPGTLQSSRRGWWISHPRMLAVYLARKHTAATYSEIGRYFGKRNHSTVVAAEKKVRAWYADNAELPLGKRTVRVRELLEQLEQELLR
ncbi:MAG: DnaA/Hda family protein [Gemmataceae bacterium]|nr:DnaA/Hda family protein [Gemmataceae bacterium]